MKPAQTLFPPLPPHGKTRDVWGLRPPVLRTWLSLLFSDIFLVCVLSFPFFPRGLGLQLHCAGRPLLCSQTKTQLLDLALRSPGHLLGGLVERAATSWLIAIENRLAGWRGWGLEAWGLEYWGLVGWRLGLTQLPN